MFCLKKPGEYAKVKQTEKQEVRHGYAAFNGGFATAIAERMPIETALKFATCTAAISVTRYGSSPSMPRRDEILEMMQKEFGIKEK